MGNHQAPNLHSPTGRRKQILPLATPTLVGEPCNTCKQTLGILWIMSCDCSWRISAGRLHYESWMHPQKLPTNTLGKSCREWGSWCGWLGGHFSEGRVGCPRATILISCPCTTRWRVGAQRTTSLPPCTYSTWWGCRTPNKYTSHGVVTWYPWINTFSSNATPSKMEASFQQWYHDVQCVKDHYPESVVRESIVHSLKRVAADMARYMGPTTSMAHIFPKMTYFQCSSVIWCTDANFL